MANLGFYTKKGKVHPITARRTITTTVHDIDMSDWVPTTPPPMSGNIDTFEPENLRTTFNVSPPLRWHKVPGAVTFTIIMEDIDAVKNGHPFVHWVIYNLLQENVESEYYDFIAANLDHRGIVDKGLNSYGHPGYDGPDPPAGSGIHRYVFHIYALNKIIDPHMDRSLLFPTAEDVREAMKGSIMNEQTITKTYENHE